MFELMPRPSRHAVLGDGPGTVHVIVRFVNGEHFLEQESLKEVLYASLCRNKKRFDIEVYAYCFMSSHYHLDLHFESTDKLSGYFQAVNCELATAINRIRGRTGHVLGDRPKSPLIQDGRHLLTTMRYMDLNPVRACMVEKAHHYAWSSYRHYAFGEPDELIDDAPDYLGLSSSPALRRKIYRELVNTMAGGGRTKRPEYDVWTFIGEPDWRLAKLRAGGFLRPRKPPD
jgi:putative transposase